jgi:hypothetical protein
MSVINACMWFPTWCYAEVVGGGLPNTVVQLVPCVISYLKHKSNPRCEKHHNFALGNNICFMFDQ